MITIKDFLEATEYKITGGSDFGWECYGPNARYLDCDMDDEYSINCVFDSVDQAIYEVQAWDYRNNRTYRWFADGCRDAYQEEANRRGIGMDNDAHDTKFTDLEVADDILEKIVGIVNDEEYDDRVKVPVDFTDEELLKYMKIAHERDITFNQLIEEALRAAIEEHQRDPEAMLARAQRWKEEHE